MSSTFEQLWSLWPQEGRRRTEGRAKTSTKAALTPMQRAREGLNAAPVSHDLVLAAAKAYVEGLEDPKYCMGLHRWLEQARWENENAVTGAASQIEPSPKNRKRWQEAEGQVRAMLAAMSEQGCPDDVLDGLFSDGVGVTHVNRPKGMPPTPVLKTHYGMNLFYRAASGYAKRAGYNEVAYSPEYVAFATERRAKERSEATFAASARAARDFTEGAASAIEDAMDLMADI